MSAKKLILDWGQIEADCRILARKLKGQPVDLIVAITKGGLVPAVILADKYLGKPHIITLQLEEISAEGKANYQAKEVLIISELNNYPILGKSVLIIDDVADTGTTLAKAQELVRGQQPKQIVTAVLHCKPRSLIHPDFFARTIPSHTWIVYPWE